ncbi:MAG: hypothetical protein J6C05_04350 [Prevotella sp.]|nr:hypothetical protein [Prevotella sp.]
MNMMWYKKRSFAIPTMRLGKMALSALADEPAEDSLFKEMWNECKSIAQDVLATDYFKGILNNNLDPNAYGSLMVQDAYYCFKAQDSYAAAATHAMDEDCEKFMQAKFDSYAEYNKYYHNPWCVREASGVIPGNAIKTYADYEAYVAQHLDSPYVFAVMLPCEYLWNWVANELAKTADPKGLYYFWIEGNGGKPEGAYQMAAMLERYRNRIDEAKAKEIFRTAMEHEKEVFTCATKLKYQQTKNI